MKPDYAAAGARAPHPEVAGLRISVPVIVALVLAAVLLVYLRTTISMVAIWYRSDTFAHGFVVIPLFLYLLWRQRDELAALPVVPSVAPVFALPIAGFVWLVADRLAINSLAQLAMMAMVPIATWALLGRRIMNALAWPFALLFFAVPLGEVLIPQLMEWTADFAVFALQVTGVPVLREGNLLTIPSGTWAVVEACSGVRYLIASLMVGVLFAYLSFRSPWRRAAFMVAAVVVPVVANWLRAYLIVLIGHLSNNRLAAGVDHLIYGWIFFGVVIALLFWVGSRWREDEQAAAPPAQAEPQRVADRRLMPIAAVVIVTTAAWPLIAHSVSTRTRGAGPAALSLAAPAGWTLVPTPLTAWVPDLDGNAVSLHQTYTKDGRRVSLYVAFFPESTPTSKAISISNQLVRPTNPMWRELGVERANVTVAGRKDRVPIAQIARTNEQLLAARWFWADGELVTSEAAAKLRELTAILRGRSDPVAWIVVYTSSPVPRAEAPAVLAGFLGDAYPGLEAMLRSAAAEP